MGGNRGHILLVCRYKSHVDNISLICSSVFYQLTCLSKQLKFIRLTSMSVFHATCFSNKNITIFSIWQLAPI